LQRKAVIRRGQFRVYYVENIAQEVGFAVMIACQDQETPRVADVADFYSDLCQRPELAGSQSKDIRVYTGMPVAIGARVRKDLAELAIAGDVDLVVVTGLKRPLGECAVFAKRLGITVLEGELVKMK